ncbi:ribosomal protein L16 [Puccinia sorghi]|uniref:Mediator of RNA polymerase II transcription subunit 7 n=1 Tax=Puccinia sorghi TaxID=27349 RepID=A0A0L6VJE5_9BASI|nr:ribosomal protein L16 [Puccinia sorghi]
MSGQQRTRTELAPRKFKYRKAFKGKPPIRTGGSTVGTTLEHGQYGLRVLEACRLSAKTLHSCETAIKRAIKPTKGAKCYLRVFPDLPVCVKGNETRMGKGKGPFEYWACRAAVGRVIFEVGGGGIQREMAFAALQHAKPRLPVKSEFIQLNSKPRLGAILLEESQNKLTHHTVATLNPKTIISNMYKLFTNHNITLATKLQQAAAGENYAQISKHPFNQNKQSAIVAQEVDFDLRTLVEPPHLQWIRENEGWSSFGDQEPWPHAAPRPSLEGMPKLYHQLEPKHALQALLNTLIHAYIQLLDVLANQGPVSLSTTPSHPITSKTDQIVSHIELAAFNMHGLCNDLRPRKRKTS